MKNKIFGSFKTILKCILPEALYLDMRKCLFCILDFLLFIFASCYMWFLNLRRTTKITFVNSERIGHFALHVDLFFRIKKIKNIREVNILLITLPVCNEFLLQKWGEIGRVVDYRKTPIFAYMLKTLFLYKSRYIREMPYSDNDCEIYRLTKSAFVFTREEKKYGDFILQENGINQKDWFVCIFARDNEYTKRVHGGNVWQSNQVRNTNIDNLISSIDYIIQKGGWVIRLGKFVEKRFSYIHPRFIDYPFETWRSDFMDFYLQYRAKFILASSTSGAVDISSLFDTPCCGVNMPFYFNQKYKNSIHQPMKIMKHGSALSLMEWIKLTEECEGKYDKFFYRFADFMLQDFYDKNNLTCVENTPEEILELVKEMFERLDGSFEQNDEDKRLQEKYFEIYKNYTFFANNKNPIGKIFLRKNANWFLKEHE